MTQQHYSEKEDGFHSAAGVAAGQCSAEPAELAATRARGHLVEEPFEPGVTRPGSGQSGEQSTPLTRAARGFTQFQSYALRGMWFKDDAYADLRNAAWMVRNARVGQANNPLALRVVVAEVERLLASGQLLPDIVEALCELLVHP